MQLKRPFVGPTGRWLCAVTVALLVSATGVLASSADAQSSATPTAPAPRVVPVPSAWDTWVRVGPTRGDIHHGPPYASPLGATERRRRARIYGLAGGLTLGAAALALGVSLPRLDSGTCLDCGELLLFAGAASVVGLSVLTYAAVQWLWSLRLSRRQRRPFRGTGRRSEWALPSSLAGPISF